MDAKEYLMQVRRLNARLKVINSTIERLRDDINSLSDVSIKSTWPDGQPHGTKITDPTGTSALRILDATEEKRQQLREELLRYEYEQISAHSILWQKQIEILDKLSRISDPVLFKILNYRYIEGKSFEWIAVEINYTWRHTINLHGKALEEMQKILNAE